MNKLFMIATSAFLPIIIYMLSKGLVMNSNKYQNLSLNSYDIHTGGGMLGISDDLKVSYNAVQDIVTVYKARSNEWYLNPQAETYVVDSSLMDKIKQVIIDEKLYEAAKLPISKMQILDAATTTYSFSFSDGEYINYSNSQELTMKIYEANKKIVSIIDECCMEGVAYPTIYTEAYGDFSEWKDQGAITIDCSNESASSFCVNLYNGTDEPVDLTGDVTYSRIDGEHTLFVETLVSDYSMHLYPNGSDYVIAHLPSDHPQKEGTYRIKYADYETTFELKAYKIGE